MSDNEIEPTVPMSKVPVAWEPLEDAFENNAPEVHSYLHLTTGEVIRIVDGVADPEMHARIVADAGYLRVDPVSSREQYRWMERFIVTVEDEPFRNQLLNAIDGKGAFRRFKDVLMGFPVERERWFAFRSERLRSCMEAWLEAHGIERVERDQWPVPDAEQVMPVMSNGDGERTDRGTSRAMAAAAKREQIIELAQLLPVRDLEVALAFMEFLRERKHLPRPQAKTGDALAASLDREQDS